MELEAGSGVPLGSGSGAKQETDPGTEQEGGPDVVLGAGSGAKQETGPGAE